MANLKVLMMGGRRCGKTSVLASMFDQMIHTKEIHDLLSVGDQTRPETKIGKDGIEERQERLDNKCLELKSFLKVYNDAEFLIDKGPTSNYWLYHLQILLAGTNKDMMIEFRDSNGEFFEFGGQFTTQTENYLKDCDVYVIVVDTPYLMSEEDGVPEAANVTDSIHSFLSGMDVNKKKIDAKCVLFVPAKCEYWLHKKEIEKVKSKIREKYKSTIDFLIQRPNTELAIIPIETAGDIEFAELRDALIIRNKDKEKPVIIKEKDYKGIETEKSYPFVKCSKNTNKIAILPNGKPYSLKDDEKFDLHYESVFKYGEENLDIPRPFAWYNHRNEHPRYQPKNCEQVTLHILRFMLNKARKNQTDNEFVQFFRRVFGKITINDLNKTIVEITNKNLIKDNVDGIERLKIY